MNEINNLGRRPNQQFTEKNSQENRQKKSPQEALNSYAEEGEKISHKEWKIPPLDTESGQVAFKMLEDMASELSNHPFYLSKGVRYLVKQKENEAYVVVEFGEENNKQTTTVTPTKLVGLWKIINKETVTIIKGGLIDSLN